MHLITAVTLSVSPFVGSRHRSRSTSQLPDHLIFRAQRVGLLGPWTCDLRVHYAIFYDRRRNRPEDSPVFKVGF